MQVRLLPQISVNKTLLKELSKLDVVADKNMLSTSTQLLSMPLNAYVPLNFKGENEKIANEDITNEEISNVATSNKNSLIKELENHEELGPLVKDLMKFEDVHCPNCGVKMLSKDAYARILGKGELISDPKEFVSWLEENEESIPNNRKAVLPIAKKSVQFSFVNDTDALFDNMKEQIILNLDNVVSDMKKIADDFTEKYSFSENDKLLLEECKQRLESIEFSGEFLKNTENVLSSILNSMESEYKKWIYFQMRQVAIESGKLIKALTVGDGKESADRRREILQNIFVPSKQKLRTVYWNIPVEEQFASNFLLTCESCHKYPPFKLFTNHKLHPELKDNYINYITDISRNIIEQERYHVHANSLIQFTGLVGHLSKRAIVTRFRENPTLVKLKTIDFQSHRNDLDFPFVNFNDVPCSTCGMPTITHEKKQEFFEKIKATNNLQELNEFFDENYRSLNRTYKPMVKLFMNELKRNPDIDEKQMYTILKKFVTDDLNNHLLLVSNWCDEIFSQLTDYNDIVLIQKLKQSIKEDFYNKIGIDDSFDYSGYKDLLADTIYKVSDQRIRTVYGTRFKEAIRKKMNTRLLFFHEKDLVEKIGSELKLWAQDLYKGSVATVDHIVARNRGGVNAIENCSVMCKNCNSEKTNYSIRHWAGVHKKEIALNMQKYLDHIIYLLRTGQVKNQESYPFEFTKNLFEATEGKILLDLSKMKTIKNKNKK